MDLPKRVRGMQDILPEDQIYFSFLKKVFRHKLRKNGFRRITTPLLEKKELFTKSIGEGTDIVDNEMYNLVDKKGRELVIKPESTAGIMRAYIDNDIQSEPQPVHLYYIEPHFRYDRPQKGRYRQFFQAGAEVIGEKDPIIDAELIYIGYTLLNRIGLSGDFKVKINSIGTLKDREKHREALLDYYSNKTAVLCENCRQRLKTNPLRLIDCKKEDCRILLSEAPKITKHLKKDSKLYYSQVKEYLDLLGVEYEEDPLLVRGLDYYCHTVWEFSDNSGRSQDSLGGGGRYDKLAESIGNKKEIPGAGFAMGQERLVIALKEKGMKIKSKDKIGLYFIQLGDEAKKVVLPLALEARNRGINTLFSLGTPSIKAQMKKANRIGAKFVVMIGVMEARNGKSQVRNMEDGTQEEVLQKDLLDYIISKTDEKDLDFYNPYKEIEAGPLPNLEDTEIL